MNSRSLSQIEKKTYDWIREKGEVRPRDLPEKSMIGAVANLKNKGLVEIFKKYTGHYRNKKKKFVRIKNINEKDHP